MACKSREVIPLAVDAAQIDKWLSKAVAQRETHSLKRRPMQSRV